MYSRVAELSPHGQGSISMLEELLPRWRGKALVLCLLGFAATGFIITITLSAADATAHIIENPLAARAGEAPDRADARAARGARRVFLKGFREAIGSRCRSSASTSLLNVVVLAWGVHYLWLHPATCSAWTGAATAEHGSPASMMLSSRCSCSRSSRSASRDSRPASRSCRSSRAIRATPRSTRAGRIRNTKKLLTAAALIMSVLLIGSSVVTTLLIPPEAFAEGGAAYGRALAYLAHEHLGEAFGTVYDLSTIAILWFAGASAMAGLLNLVPRYLPRYGMAPEWAKAHRPLVLIFTAITFLVTILFKADVDAQGGAYATGVLVLMSSAALAVTLAGWRDGRPWVGYMLLTLVFVYTTVVNIFERPDGIKIASWFIVDHHRHVAGLAGAALDRAARPGGRARRDGAALHPRGGVDAGADHREPSRHRPAARSTSTSCAKRASRITCRDERVLFLEVRPGDVSEFSGHCGSRVSTSAGTTCCAASARRFRTRSPRCCSTSATRPAHSARVLRLDRGQSDRVPAEVPRASAKATRRRSPAKCCARPSRTRCAGRASTSGERPRAVFVDSAALTT